MKSRKPANNDGPSVNVCYHCHGLPEITVEYAPRPASTTGRYVAAIVSAGLIRVDSRTPKELWTYAVADCVMRMRTEGRATQ